MFISQQQGKVLLVRQILGDLATHQRNLQRALDGCMPFFVPTSGERERIVLELLRLDAIVNGMNILIHNWRSPPLRNRMPHRYSYRDALGDLLVEVEDFMMESAQRGVMDGAEITGWLSELHDYLKHQMNNLMNQDRRDFKKVEYISLGAKFGYVSLPDRAGTRPNRIG